MKKFNDLCREALLITSIKPESDSIGPVTKSEEPVSKDMFSQSVNDFMGQQSSEDITQPTDDQGEFGEIQAGDASSDQNVELECTGDGMRVKFGEMEIVLPKYVIEKIKSHVEHEEDETDKEETAEHQDSPSEEEDETQTNPAESEEKEDDSKEE